MIGAVIVVEFAAGEGDREVAEQTVTASAEVVELPGDVSPSCITAAPAPASCSWLATSSDELTAAYPHSWAS